MPRLPSPTQYRLRRARLVILLGGECSSCGTARRLEFHHEDGNGGSACIGGWQQLLKLEREVEGQMRAGREDVTLKCRPCHQARHRDMGIEPPGRGEEVE